MQKYRLKQRATLSTVRDTSKTAKKLILPTHGRGYNKNCVLYPQT